jgi:epoxyqueuosine reductase
LASLADTIRDLAGEAGFDLVAIGPADVGEDGARFAAWLDAGRAGEMHYLARNRDRIADPARWSPGARSAISLAQDYGGPPGRLPGGGRIARYAVGRDYHRTLGRAGEQVRAGLERAGIPRDRLRIGTDAVPVLERALAVRAGIGFLAHSAGVISPVHGPYLLLSEVLAPVELPFDPVATGSCGTCRRCLEACPTGAITAPFEVDARRCLSYTTIELRGPIPVELRAPQADWLFGCDVCLEVCPFTKFGRAARPHEPRPAGLAPHPVVESWTLAGILALDEAAWATDWTGTAIRRATRSGLRRNAAVVLGNLRDESALPALVAALGDPDPLVRGHAAWAIGRIAPRHESLPRVLAREADGYVRGELEAALAGRG